jgi:hypothetical protein
LVAATVAAAPASARDLTTDDVAVGGKYLAAPLQLNSDNKFQRVISIGGIKFTKSAAKARLLAFGTLSLSNKEDGGPGAIVRLRVVIDGKPEPLVLRTRVADGDLTTAPISIQCNGFLADGLAHTVSLEAAVLGPGQVTVDAGNFDLMAFRPIFNPP